MIFDPSTGVATEYPIREIFQKFYLDYARLHPVNEQQAKAAGCISKCKSGLLGYNISYCKECGHTEIHAVSCNNRDCPSCQAPLEKKWVMERESELIEGIAYYHVIFTVPHELNDLIYVNQKLLYDLLFSCASDTLITLCRDKKYMGATPGIVSVLHSWGQQMNFHPHLHVALSGGGITHTGNFIETRHKGFIIPEQVIAKMFRGKYLDSLKKYYNSGKLSLTGKCEPLRNSYNWKKFIDNLYSKKWCPFVKETFNGNGNAMEYLARYAYRTAISNSRIESISENEVSFRYTDYSDNNKKKTKTVSGEEFIRLFLLHVLPKGFHRVRFSGYLSNCRKTKELKHIHRLRGTIYSGNPVKGKGMADLMLLLYGVNICQCPVCRHQMVNNRGMHPPSRSAA